MKCYKLLKDLPTFKAGQLAYISRLGNLVAGAPEEPETTSDRIKLMIYHANTIEKFPNILTEWFEEVKESIDSIYREPEAGEKYWFIDYWGDAGCANWANTIIDVWRLNSGNIYRTEEECQQDRERKLAEVRLRRTSTFKPDFKDGDGGWAVCYYHGRKELDCIRTYNCDSGEPVHYKTYEDAQRSIKENRKDWLTYLGIEDRE